MAKKKLLYPFAQELEDQREQPSRREQSEQDEQPEYIYGKPNYDKYKSWSIEKILSWYNID